jgi:hypothetical protein
VCYIPSSYLYNKVQYSHPFISCLFSPNISPANPPPLPAIASPPNCHSSFKSSPLIRRGEPPAPCRRRISCRERLAFTTQTTPAISTHRDLFAMAMYGNHRGLGAPSGNNRLNELLDGIRAEFESQARASGEYEHSSKLCPCGGREGDSGWDYANHLPQTVSQQIQEMQMVREKVYAMEQTHLALKQK